MPATPPQAVLICEATDETYVLTGRHPSVIDTARWLDHTHLPAHLRAATDPLIGAAIHLLATLEDSAELTLGLRKLVEAKDCFVRAHIAADLGVA